MSGFLEFCLGASLLMIVLFFISSGGTSKDRQELVDGLTEMKKFLMYVENHKEELPPNMRERWDEMEQALK